MERVERLTSNASPTINGRSRNSSTPDIHPTTKPFSIPKKSSKSIEPPESTGSQACAFISETIDDPLPTNLPTRTRQHPPISILKHKLTDFEAPQSPGSSTYTTTLIVQQLSKKHGILKKRSSLDDNEILCRRRSCSPDPAYPEINGTDFKPILKYERRSSLDELIKRSRSPDQQHPTSILKRKLSGEEERDDGTINSTEPTSILKRSSSSTGKSSNIFHNISNAAVIAKTLGCTIDSLNGGSTEVRPILKKKFSREESSSSDPPSLEPRPILKKKSSTDSDEHDEKPKKTILKSSRISSQEDSGTEMDGASPKKLSMLKNRSAQRRTNSLPECDVVRPILKQCSSRESSSPSRSSLSGTVSPGDGSLFITKDLFLRKRARSVGHMQSTINGREDWLRTECSHGEYSFLPVDRNNSQIITRSNENATTTTTTATSSIAPIVSFKLPSR